MKIEIVFEGGSSYWKQKVTRNALYVGSILSTPAFIQKVAAHRGFDFTKDTAAQVADKIAKKPVAKIKVGFYYNRWFTRAIAYEENGAVYINTAKESYGAGGWGNIMHELMHALGYSHNGNSPSGQANTVPWQIVTLAQQWLDAGGVIAPPQVVTALEV